MELPASAAALRAHRRRHGHTGVLPVPERNRGRGSSARAV
jgi:hypothetical protein